MTGLSWRAARLDDAAEIHALLLRVAPEIPLLVDTLEREETLYVLCRNCARSGESWVACDAGRIVGFVLAEPNQRARHYAENEVLDLHYAAVAPEYRNRGVFAELMARLLDRRLPVTASVAAANRSDFAGRLERLGFRATGSAGGAQQCRREP